MSLYLNPHLQRDRSKTAELYIQGQGKYINGDKLLLFIDKKVQDQNISERRNKTFEAS
jgi:hypothetical protein